MADGRAGRAASAYLRTGVVSSAGLGEVQGGAEGAWLARCRKCRALLCTAAHEVAHEQGKGWKGKKQGQTDQPVECTSIFVEPMRWMADDIATRAGVVSCHSCGARLGDFDWAGLTCSCGAWVTPAFQLRRAKVDVETIPV